MKAYLLSYLIEASICQTAFYLFYRFFLRQETSFAFNRMYLLLAILLSVAIPFIEIPLSEDAVYMQYHTAITDISSLTNEGHIYAFVKEASATTSNSPAITIFFYSYLTVCILLLIRLLYQITGLLYICYRNTSIKVQDYRLIHTYGKLPTFSFFHLLFWDNSRSLSPENRNFILQHELIHIRQWHSLDVLLLELFKIIFWFNPAIYLLKKALQQTHEFLADAAVTTHQNTEAYVQLMVNQLFTNINLTITSSFNKHQLQARIAMIHKTKKASPAFWKAALSLPTVVLLTFIYSCRTSEAVLPGTATKGVAEYKLREIVVTGYVAKKNVDSNQSLANLQSSKTGKNMEDLPPIEAKDLESMPVENRPVPDKGYDDFYKSIMKYIKYPASARAEFIQGKVWVQFVVKSNGTISDIEIYRGVQQDIDKESVRVIKEVATGWKPATENGKAVDMKLLMPIGFLLGS